ncbi:hypothetical protein GQ607_003267 [Colletotrichum asianum]|uniref:Uncharacterized protein n=1 Tax=Colletotrichum asianum TaxID=702518 RepID=A0A8H3WLV8_9PEZI|nr:hypothetical protein GQ607_003267 [Colletotrichum asianum]
MYTLLNGLGALPHLPITTCLLSGEGTACGLGVPTSYASLQTFLVLLLFLGFDTRARENAPPSWLVCSLHVGPSHPYSWVEFTFPCALPVCPCLQSRKMSSKGLGGCPSFRLPCRPSGLKRQLPVGLGGYDLHSSSTLRHPTANKPGLSSFSVSSCPLFLVSWI